MPDKFKMCNSTSKTVTYGSTMSVAPDETREIVTIAMTGDGTLSLSADAKPTLGDELILKVSSDGTARTLAFGTGFTAPSVSGAINKTKVLSLVYDGSTYIATAAAVQIN